MQKDRIQEIIDLIEDMENEERDREQRIKRFGYRVIEYAIDEDLDQIDVIVALAKLIETFASVPCDFEEDEDV